MPQLDKVSFVSQIFWFVLIFGILYVVILRWILPMIALTLKIRKKKIEKFISINNKKEYFDENYIKIFKNYVENTNKLTSAIDFFFVKTLHNYNVFLVYFFFFTYLDEKINNKFIDLYLKKELLNLNLNE